MKSIDDSSFFNLPEVASDLSTSFEKIWHELDELEPGGTDTEPSSKVRAGCTGELVHVGSIFLVGVRVAPRIGQLVEFTCPRCGKNHESQLFS